MKAAMLALVALLSINLAGQGPALKIVVLEGENAVNIIQQKTALRAVVEVRDQNNLPVAGAAVTFAIAGNGGATVAGAQAITVVTSATGQAALTGVTPLTSGALRISVNAVFNGLTASTSITQTVATTAAAAGAAGATGAAGAGAGGATGGGLSGAAIAGIVGGAAAVGGGIAAAGGGTTQSTSAPGPPASSSPTPVAQLPSCEFEVSPHDNLVGNEGATIGLTIRLKNAGPCYDASWAINLGGVTWVSANPLSGSGSGSAVITIAPYSPTPSAPNRVATIIVAYEQVVISQPCRCPQ